MMRYKRWPWLPVTRGYSYYAILRGLGIISFYNVSFFERWLKGKILHSKFKTQFIITKEGTKVHVKFIRTHFFTQIHFPPFGMECSHTTCTPPHLFSLKRSSLFFFFTLLPLWLVVGVVIGWLWALWLARFLSVLSRWAAELRPGSCFTVLHGVPSESWKQPNRIQPDQWLCKR